MLNPFKNFVVLLISFTILNFGAYSQAGDDGNNQAQDQKQNQNEDGQKDDKEPLRQPAEFQKIIADYKSYVAKVPPEVRDEIIEYRQKIVALNNEKKKLYEQLSHSAQDYLLQERKFKDSLPMKRRNLIKIEAAPSAEDKEKDKSK